MKRLRVCDRVTTSHEACTSGTSRVLKVASLQQLKMETFIPAPADREMWSVITYLNAQSIAPIEIHCQLCHYGHTRLDDKHISCKSSSGMSHHRPPYRLDLAPGDLRLLLHLKKSLCGQRKGFQNDRDTEMSVTVVPIPGGKLLQHRDIKVGSTVRQISQFRR